MSSMKTIFSNVVFISLLSTCTAFGRIVKSYQDISSNDRYAAMVHEVSITDAGADLGDAQMTDLTRSIEGVFQQDTKAANISEVKVSVKRSKVQGTTGATMAAVVGHTHVSRVVDLVNQTRPQENRTKVVEETVVSLPMAAFALEVPTSTKNTTEHASQDNATENNALTQGEADAFTRQSTNSLTAGAAAGTFHAPSQKADRKPSKSFMKPKEYDPTRPIQEDKHPKADYPAMASVLRQCTSST